MTAASTPFDAKATYDATSGDYELASRDWQYLSTRTIARLALQPGETVLDVACTTVPASVEAAKLVGPTGRVVGVDYAEQMLEIAAEMVPRDEVVLQAHYALSSKQAR